MEDSVTLSKRLGSLFQRSKAPEPIQRTPSDVVSPTYDFTPPQPPAHVPRRQGAVSYPPLPPASPAPREPPRPSYLPGIDLSLQHATLGPPISPAVQPKTADVSEFGRQEGGAGRASALTMPVMNGSGGGAGGGGGGRSGSPQRTPATRRRPQAPSFLERMAMAQSQQPLPSSPSPGASSSFGGGSSPSTPLTSPGSATSTTASSTLTSGLPGLIAISSDTVARMEELGRLRRLQSQQALSGHGKAASEPAPAVTKPAEQSVLVDEPPLKRKTQPSFPKIEEEQPVEDPWGDDPWGDDPLESSWQTSPKEDASPKFDKPQVGKPSVDRPSPIQLQPDTHEFAPPPPAKVEPPVPPKRVDSNPITVAFSQTSGGAAELQALAAEKDAAIAKLRSELQASKADSARLATLNNQFERELVSLRQTAFQLCEIQDDLRSEREKSRGLALEVQMMKRSMETMKEERATMQRDVKMMEIRMAKKDKDETEWEVMHLKLARAERIVRGLDNVTRFRLEAKMDAASVFSSGKKKPARPATSPSAEIARMVEEINDEILQASLTVADGVVRSAVYPSPTGRAKHILGVRLSALLAKEMGSTSKVNLLLVQVVLEVFLVHWCVDIIEAHYPQQKTFADLLIEMTSHSSTINRLYAPQPICGRQSQILAPSESTPSFPNWSKDILSELNEVLSTGGYILSGSKHPIVSMKLGTLVKIAYDLRRGLAEKDHIGGLEIRTVVPDTHFSPRVMEDAHPDGKATMARVDMILGTASIGLQREVAGASTGAASISGGTGVGIEVVLKPKVVLPSVLEG